MVKRKVNITMDEIVYKKLVELAEKAGLSKSAVLSVLVNDRYENNKNSKKNRPAWRFQHTIFTIR